MKLKLTIVNRSGRAVPQAFLKRWVDAVSRQLTRELPKQQTASGELVVAFVSKSEIRRLNRQFRGKNKPTDVLSFESSESSGFGELAISPEVISKQAREHGLLVREELSYMVLHGILHLLGFDHEKSAREAQKMFALQDSVFETLLGLESRRSR